MSKTCNSSPEAELYDINFGTMMELMLKKKIEEITN